MSQQPTDGYRAFPNTHWSLVVRAGGEPGVVKREALATLIGRYLAPLKSHLIYRRRIDRDLCDDLLQDFLADKVLQNGLVDKANQERGKFRTFLLTVLDRFAVNWIRNRNTRLKKHVALADEFEPADLSPAVGADFDLAWAREVVGYVLRQMKSECEASARPDIWITFEGRILRPMFEHVEPTAYPELATQLGVDSPAQVAAVLTTAKRMFHRNLKAVVGEYEASADVVDREIADLKSILARPLRAPP